MRRILALIVAIAAIALVGPVLAQPGAGGGGGTESGGGMGAGATPGRSLRRASMGRGAAAGMLTLMYDPKTITTVKGAVESLGTLPPTAGTPNAIRYALLKTEQGNIRVYLCPDWYLDQQKISLAVGDQLEVTGSKVTMEGQPAIIAKDLKKGDKTVALRDDKGSSAWPPQRRQPRSRSPAK
jgi:hypothetical protein